MCRGDVAAMEQGGAESRRKGVSGSYGIGNLDPGSCQIGDAPFVEDVAAAAAAGQDHGLQAEVAAQLFGHLVDGEIEGNDGQMHTSEYYLDVNWYFKNVVVK